MMTMTHVAPISAVSGELDPDAVAHVLAPIAMFLAVLLTITIVGGGGALVLWLWFSNRRDLRATSVPRSLKTPPSALPAPIAGTLIDCGASDREVLSALVDMADRGLIQLLAAERSELPGSEVDVRITLKVSLKEARLHAYEKTLLDAVFGPSAPVSSNVLLCSAKRRLATALPTIETQLYAAAADAGLCVRNPRFARQLGYGVSTDAIVFGIASVVAASIWLEDMLPVAAMPGLALAVVGLVGFAVATWFPTRTALGEVEAAKWRAFRTYLAETVGATPPGTDLPAHYLPYAVAFGIDTAIERHLDQVRTLPLPGRGRGSLPDYSAR
jgi:hypothetical protein